jgi:hypothetical protein
VPQRHFLLFRARIANPRERGDWALHVGHCTQCPYRSRGFVTRATASFPAVPRTDCKSARAAIPLKYFENIITYRFQTSFSNCFKNILKYLFPFFLLAFRLLRKT